MAFSSPIYISSSDEEDNTKIDATTTIKQQEQHDSRAKRRHVLKQPLSFANLAADQEASAVSPGKSRRKSVSGLGSVEDHGGSSMRSISLPQLIVNGIINQSFKPRIVTNYVAAVGYAEITQHQPQLDQPVPPSTTNSHPLKRKSTNEVEIVSKCSKIIDPATSPSRASAGVAVTSSPKSLSRPTTADFATTDSGSDRTYHSPPKAAPRSVPAIISAAKPRNKPLTSYLLADFASQLQYQFDFAAFAEKHDRTVPELLDIFSALVSTPILEFSAKGHGRIQEARAKVKAHMAAINAAFYPSRLPAKQRKGHLGTAMKHPHDLGVHDDGPARSE